MVLYLYNKFIVNFVKPSLKNASKIVLPSIKFAKKFKNI